MTTARKQGAFAICPTCEGRGSIVNPAVDGNGLTAEDFDELGDDFRDDYFGGVYDVACDECKGARVVPRCRSCDRAVEPGIFVDEVSDPTDGEDGPTVVHRPFGGCFEHLTDDEADWRKGEIAFAAMTAAELRMGA